jgi:hypothetical protein
MIEVIGFRINSRKAFKAKEISCSRQSRRRREPAPAQDRSSAVTAEVWAAGHSLSIGIGLSQPPPAAPPSVRGQLSASQPPLRTLRRRRRARSHPLPACWSRCLLLSASLTLVRRPPTVAMGGGGDVRHIVSTL